MGGCQTKGGTDDSVTGVRVELGVFYGWCIWTETEGVGMLVSDIAGSNEGQKRRVEDDDFLESDAGEGNNGSALSTISASVSNESEKGNTRKKLQCGMNANSERS